MRPILLFLIPFFGFWSHSEAAPATCPALQGNYWCDLGSTVDLEIVKQWTDPSAPGTNFYSFQYRDIGGEGEVIQASATGIQDDYGWTTHCEKGRLVSLSAYGDFRSILYLDSKKHLIREENGVVKQNCSPQTH